MHSRPVFITLFLFWLLPQTTGSDIWPAIVSVNKDRSVLLRISVEGRPPSYGSGVLITPEFVLTAKHLLPTDSVGTAKPSLLDGLIGWTNASIDFSASKRLRAEYVSSKHDLALLRFDTPVISTTSQPPLWKEEARQGQDILVMGYPDGGALDCTGGLATGEAGDGEYKTDSSVGIGFSGGPVFSSSGGLLGILLEGSGRGSDGVARRGYFLRSSVIDEELRIAEETKRLHVSSLAQTPLEPVVVSKALPELQFSYAIDDEKVDHPVVLSPSERSFEHTFDALPGYAINSATFVSRSANHVSGGPTIKVSEGGARVTISYTLQSGPLVDQWRGWIVGSVLTEQRRKIVMKYAIEPRAASPIV